MRELTPKQMRFAELYVELGNASEAYRQAYDVGVDTKSTTITRKAKELIDNGNVSATIKRLQNELRLKHEITRERLVEEYLDIINSHKELRDIFKGAKITKADAQKVYTMSNSGYINGTNVIAAINGIAKLMGLDKVEEKKQEAQIINNIQINIKRDRE